MCSFVHGTLQSLFQKMKMFLITSNSLLQISPSPLSVDFWELLDYGRPGVLPMADQQHKITVVC